MGRLQHGVGPQYNTTPLHEYEGLDFEKLSYIAPGPPPPISTTSISTTVTPLTTAGDSTPPRLLTDDDRRRMREYHESHLGNRILSHGIQFSTIKRNEKWIEQRAGVSVASPGLEDAGTLLGRVF
jgi:hypothetical protein